VRIVDVFEACRWGLFDCHGAFFFLLSRERCLVEFGSVTVLELKLKLKLKLRKAARPFLPSGRNRRIDLARDGSALRRDVVSHCEAQLPRNPSRVQDVDFFLSKDSVSEPQRWGIVRLRRLWPWD
jgi:hypothetical protein